jgi:hypothetical protein
MVRIARFGWDESLGPISQVFGRNGDSWDLPPVERDRENPNTSPRKKAENVWERRGQRGSSATRSGAWLRGRLRRQLPRVPLCFKSEGFVDAESVAAEADLDFPAA